MQVESALFFESIEQIYERVFRSIRPRTPIPTITVQFRKYANANSRIRLSENGLSVDISDLLQDAPAPVQEALASILIAKLFKRRPETDWMARYRRYLNRADMRRELAELKKQRGRKNYRDPAGSTYNLCKLFEDINREYFGGLMARPELGWSLKDSRTTLGHYDPCHHIIVLSSILDGADTPLIAVKYVLFHEMLHLRYPTEHRGARRFVHTPEFKKAEREFAQYDLAKKQLRQFLDE
jgi:predicted metal-dependent hydrolase